MHEHYAGHEFRRASEVDTHDQLRFGRQRRRVGTSPTTIGALWIVAQALVVGAFAELQATAPRR